jgi:DNA-binding phage protein
MMYLEAAFEENDTELLFEVIGDIARSEGTMRLTRSSVVRPNSLFIKEGVLPILLYG